MSEEKKSAEENTTSDTFEITLKKPAEYNGKTYSNLTFDFGKLTGEDALNIESELQAIGKVVLLPTFSGEYLIRMAAKACTEPVGVDIFNKMSLADYNRIRNAARSFLQTSE